MNTPRIAIMEAPLPDDVDAAIITSVHGARTLLSDAEDEQISLMCNYDYCNRAARLLDAAVCSLGAPVYNTRQTARVRVLRALHAAQVAAAHCRLARAYSEAPYPYDPPYHNDEFEQRTAKNAVARLRKATAFAVAETHRALTQLAEDFPHAYATIDTP